MTPGAHPKAVILAGGLGTRLRPLTDIIPKPMLPLGQKPILELLLERLQACGVQEAIIATGHKAETIEAYFQDGARVGLTLSYHYETHPLGTAGPLAMLRDQLTTPFLVVNGDIVTRLDFAALYDFHLGQGAILTVAVKNYHWRLPYGTVQVDDVRLVAIEEKPMISQLINAGIYVLNPEVLLQIPQGIRLDMPQFVATLAQEHPVTVYQFGEFWLDIGDIHDLERAAAIASGWERHIEPEDTRIRFASEDLE
jgi:NDP-sugar pyrophosphorylase family protein